MKPTGLNLNGQKVFAFSDFDWLGFWMSRCLVWWDHYVIQQRNQVMEPSRWSPSDKKLGPRGLLPLWSQVRALWLLIWWPLEAYMVVNFRAREISRSARKLAWTPTVKLKKKKNLNYIDRADHKFNNIIIQLGWDNIIYQIHTN